MKLELIKTSRYLLAVDDSKINVNDWFYLDDANVIAKYIDADPVKEALKIIAYLPLNNAPILEGVPLLPPIEDDVESMSYNPSLEYKKMYDDANTFDFKKGFVEGYNKAKEKYKFTEEDMRQAFRSGFIYSNLHEVNENSYIQSLSQPKTPTHFEFEVVPKEEGTIMLIPPCKRCVKPKTITNSQGQKIACGKYIY